MKKLALILFTLVILVLSGLAVIYTSIQPVSSGTNTVDFNVPKGANATQIGTSLFENGLIKNPTFFKIYVQLSGISAKIQVGDYKLSPSYNLFQTVGILGRTPLSVKITIPEGFTRQETADKFAKSLKWNSASVNEFLNISKNDEGYLFPDTYLVESIATPGAVIQKMKNEFENKTRELKPTHDQVILASIIEEETKGVEEKPIVSGILMNRLRIGMALQVDVAPDTYKTVGLPNSPIANPGLASLKAAVNPEKTDYLYYLHDPSAQIHYAETLDGHNANINKYLR